MSRPMIKLGEVAEFARDGVLPNHIKSGTLFVGLENIKKGGGFEGVSTVDEGELASTKFAFTPKHLLYGKLRPYLAKIALPDFEGVCSTDIIPILPGPKLDRRYLAHYLLTPKMIALASDRAAGANLPRLSPRVLIDFPIPLPPIDEQRRIAAMLDKAEELRAKRRAAIALLDQLPQAIFLEMFGDPVTNPKNWHVRTIEETTECLDRFRKPVKASDRPDGPIPYYGANGLQGWIDRALFNESLVLVAEDGGHFENPTRGVAYRIDGPAWVNNHAHILRAKANVLDVEFLHRVLRHYNFVPFISGTTRSKLTQGQLAKATIPVPPIDLQRRFAASVESTNRAKAAYQSALAESDTLFASIQSRVFAGDRR